MVRLFRRGYRVWIASTHDPIDQMRETGATSELDRWQRILQSFRKETVGMDGTRDPTRAVVLSALIRTRNGGAPSDLETLVLAESSVAPWMQSVSENVIGGLPAGPLPTRREVLYEIGVGAEPFYRGVWTACSKDEKLALRQLAEEGVVNPRNQAVVSQLLRIGLVRRDPTFRLMNETFRHFVLRELPTAELAAWEHEGIRLPWGSITTTVLTVALGLFGLLVLTQLQLVDAWVGYVPALAPAVPTVLKLFAGAQPQPKPTVTA